MNPEEKNCVTCGKMIKGRADKKYCNEFCRNYYNNGRKARDFATREINHLLAKNRRILQALIPPGESLSRVSREKLLQEGFHFNYYTHVVSTNQGATYHFCYDFGYLYLSNEWLLLIRDELAFSIDPT